MRLPSWRLVRPERANPKLSPEPLSGSRSDVLRSLPGSVATMPFLDVNAVENDPEGITFLRAVIGGTRASGATPSWNWKAVAIAPALLPQAHQPAKIRSRGLERPPSGSSGSQA
jgi:hypothetical protein